MSGPLPGMAEAQVERLISALDSLLDGDLAVPMLIACGERAVPHLEHFLLAGSPRTIALPRMQGERPNWLAPSWRILRHVLGKELERGHYGAA